MKCKLIIKMVNEKEAEPQKGEEKMINLRANPFYLDDEGIKWVEDTLQGMTVQDKIGQLFCVLGMSSDEGYIQLLTKQLGVGGVMYRPEMGKQVQEAHRMLQGYSKIPLLLAANLEAGGNGSALDGTNFGKPMQVGATDDAKMGYYLGKVACGEGALVGCNWAFAPIVDIDMNFRNPITNLRTFGGNADIVLKMASGYLKAADEENVAVSIKHFPGDGVDERDQHLHMTVNSLSVEEWEASYGRIYRQLIDQGAKTVMVAHICQPAYTRLIHPDIKDEDIMPASLSPELLQGLLRERMQFNGLIVTDATQMIGFTAAMPRKQAVPHTIASGADMFLFTKNLEEDYQFMMDGYTSGVITDERLSDAVTRILATKASLKLHQKQREGTLVPEEAALSQLKKPEFAAWAKECADKAITLVKDTQGLLPLSPAKTQRVLLNVLEDNDDINSPLRSQLKALLEKEGFEVTVKDRAMPALSAASIQENPEVLMKAMMEVMGKVEDFKCQYDLVLYAANFETASNNTVVRINWHSLMGIGNDNPWFVKEIPTLFVSLANPYHLLDVPMIKTFVNAYTSNEYVLESLIEKLMGRSGFKGTSPVDPFCGRWDTRL